MGEYLQQVREEVGSHPVSYGGLAAGVAAEALDYVTDINLYTVLFNPWGIDHGLHYMFNIGLTHVSDRALEYAVEHPSLTQKVLVSGTVVAGFTLTKEYGLDTAPDYIDMAGNVFGWGSYRVADYGLNNLKDDAQDFGQHLYDSIR